MCSCRAASTDGQRGQDGDGGGGQTESFLELVVIRFS